MPQASTTTREPIRLGDFHFLSPVNPIATADQREMEKQALHVMQDPAIRQATESATRRFKMLAGDGVPDEAYIDFDKKMDEWALHYVLLALNSDPNYPMVQNDVYGPPHTWFGIDVPGSRGTGTGDNVDNNYTVIPVDGRSRYELHGQRMEPGTGDMAIHVVANLSMSSNISGLSRRDIEMEDEGSFVITIGPEPADGRPNHLQTAFDARYIFTRDVRVDWRQVPTAYRIHRVDPPTAPPLTVEEKTALAARMIVDDVASNYWFMQMIRVVGPNTVAQPESTGFFGGLSWQKLGRGRFVLEDDEAFVLTLNTDDAHYLSLQLNDYWLMTLNYWSRQTTLTSGQTAQNADGTHTYVFSATDPGVHNWIDTMGQRETLLLIRMQWAAATRVTGTPPGHDTWSKGQLVKLGELDDVLPADIKRVTPEERAQQLDERIAAFNLRFTV